MRGRKWRRWLIAAPWCRLNFVVRPASASALQQRVVLTHKRAQRPVTVIFSIPALLPTICRIRIRISCLLTCE